MDDRVKTSFIPKASLKVEQKKTPKGVSVGIFNVIGTIILIIAVVAAVGAFLFEQFTIQSIQNKKQSLEKARAAFQPATIKELSRLDTRLQSGAALLSSHVSPSKLFDEIEKETLSSVRFRDFLFGESGPNRVTVTMSGEATSFNAVALQSDRFGSSDIFSEVIFSNLNVGSTGNVVFNFSAVVNVNEVLFSKPQVAAPVVQPETDVDTSNQPQL